MSRSRALGTREPEDLVPGHDAPGCFVDRRPDDLKAIRAAALALPAFEARGPQAPIDEARGPQAPMTGGAAGRAGVVIGGGLPGLEAANALRLPGPRYLTGCSGSLRTRPSLAAAAAGSTSFQVAFNCPCTGHLTDWRCRRVMFLDLTTSRMPG